MLIPIIKILKAYISAQIYNETKTFKTVRLRILLQRLVYNVRFYMNDSFLSTSLPDKKKVSECDQEIPQSRTADKTMALRGRATQHHETPGRQNKVKQPPLS